MAKLFFYTIYYYFIHEWTQLANIILRTFVSTVMRKLICIFLICQVRESGLCCYHTTNCTLLFFRKVFVWDRSLIIDKIQVGKAKDSVSKAKDRQLFLETNVYYTESSLKRLRSII